MSNEQHLKYLEKESQLLSAVRTLPATPEANLVRVLTSELVDARRDFIMSMKVEAGAMKQELDLATGDL